MKKQNCYNINQNVSNGNKPFKKFSSNSIIFHCFKWKRIDFLFRRKQDQGKGSPLTSKGLAKLFPRIQKLYQITYIFCTTLSSLSIQHFYTNWFPARGALGLQCISRVQLIIQRTHLPSCFPCHYVTSLLAYCKV